MTWIARALLWRLVVVGQGGGHGLDRVFEFWQVVVDGGLQDGVGRVEVAVGQVIAQAGDLTPWDCGCVSSRSAGRALTASPISSSQIRTASKTSPSVRAPRCRCERIASVAAWMSASRCRSR